jgi:hypothetical protein
VATEVATAIARPYTGLSGGIRVTYVGMMQPETRYARLGSERIAYQVVGEGPRDLVLTGDA